MTTGPTTVHQALPVASATSQIPHQTQKSPK